MKHWVFCLCHWCNFKRLLKRLWKKRCTIHFLIIKRPKLSCSRDCRYYGSGRGICRFTGRLVNESRASECELREPPYPIPEVVDAEYLKKAEEEGRIRIVRY